ncbi:MAG TPA: hypothetical protein GX707_00450 [Epulopiscium sp.]|nr:hypothetical protein [Candidatus Epulonipiscium sp.]
MAEKIPVIIEPVQKTEYSFSNLDYCTQCGSYTTLKEGSCLKCKGDKFISFESMIDKMCRRRNKKEIVFLLNIFLVLIILGGVIFPINTIQLMVSVAILIICLASLIIIQKKFSQSFRLFEIDETIRQEGYIIQQSLELDSQRINGYLEEGDYLEAYKGLRNIGAVVKKEYVKTAKIRCLNRFILRSDMPLEMDELLLSGYHKDLIKYIYEISKLQRNLIKQPTIDYCIQNQHYIQKDFNNANVILGNVAGAAVYSRNSLELNKDFIIKYVNDIPQERILRIQKLLSTNTKYDWDELQEAILAMKGASYEES